MKRVSWFILFLVMGVSCLDQPDCFRQTYNLMGISFKKIKDGKADTVYLNKIIINGNMGVTIGDTDSLVTYLQLPLNYLLDSTSFAIQTLVQDYSEKILLDYSIGLSHSSQAQYVSEECGTRFIVSNLKTIHENFDSLRLVSTALSNPSHTNLEVYRCPRMNVMRFTFRQLYMDTLFRGKLDSRAISTITTPGTTLYRDTTMSAVLLPIDKEATTSTYNFKFGNGDINKVTVNYSSNQTVSVKRCEPQKVFSGLNVGTGGTNFSILKVTNDSLQDPPSTNIETFRCPTTNQIKVLFRQLRGSSKVSDTVRLQSFKADFLPSDSILYVDSMATTILLPLNPSANVTTTTYSFVIDEVPHTLVIGYIATSTLYHKVCDVQTVFTQLVASSPDFDKTKVVINVPIQLVAFPAVNNIEIVKQN